MSISRSIPMAGRLVLGMALLVPRLTAAGGTWQPLAHQPTFAASTMFLLTDGTVICQKEGAVNWWKLTPDANGSYVNGTWAKIAKSHYDRLYYAAGVLADGRVIVSGGEYSSSGSETNKTEIYDPVLDTWTEISAPSGWSNVGDAPNAVLSDGRFLLGSIFDNRTAFYDPVAGSWTAGPRKLDSSATEESWVLLPDGTVTVPECANHPHAEKYVPSLNKWISTGSLPVDIVEAASLEVGPGVLLPDGRSFFMGATPHSVLYTMPANPGDAGTWTVGPDPPKVSGNTIGAKDAPGCLLTNGHVLLALGRVDGVGGDFFQPTYFFEFDGTSIVRIADPGNSGNYPFEGRMLLLPTGEVIFTNGTASVYVYTPSGGPDPSWKPTITSVPTTLTRNQSFVLEGTQLNGLSQAVGYGDDSGCNTNYPLVRLTNAATGHVFYCRTHDHSTMAVATGSAIVSTNFIVPAAAELGPATLTVVANGIPSDGVSVVLSDETDVSASSVSIFRGVPVSGGLPELASSDDQYLVVARAPFFGAWGAPVQIVAEGISPTATPSGLQFTLEAAVSAGGLDQKIELLNHASGQYELVDLRAASTSDAAVSITLSGSLARFVAPGTRAMKARISFQRAGLVQVGSWDARLDQVLWIVNG